MLELLVALIRKTPMKRRFPYGTVDARRREAPLTHRNGPIRAAESFFH